ncbi:hypothetical protein [Halorubrum vacuolatum]|uniref:Zn-dependent protease with chaperone function n=1 Tax=Halorubrum vacuolatum TaxID=63740 RepID=A0A238WUM5_HALVU|nr:hypothetical protein [Halorubrum vacuolatum]SNR50222.1 hypothetical protein SAMN06264855_11067 [Halorubrum vacuolatum]
MSDTGTDPAGEPADSPAPRSSTEATDSAAQSDPDPPSDPIPASITSLLTEPSRRRSALGLLAFVLVPVVLATPVAVPIALLAGFGPLVGLLLALVGGPAVSAAVGPILLDRRIDRLPAADLEDRPSAFIEHRVSELAGSVGVEPPTVRIVRGTAANVAVADGYRGATLVVSTRLLSLPQDDRDAALRHALVRLQRREVAITTALLPAAVAVETLAIVATLLVGRRNDRGDTDRRVNRIHGYEPERGRVPGPVAAAAGVLLWILILPAWLPFVVADRFHVAEGRRAADVAVSRVGKPERDGLANALSFAREAAGAADWPPLFDRLSLLSMADETTDRVRGTTPQETRIRLARLRSKRAV